MEVAADEKAIVDAIAALRRGNSSSLEAIGYRLGTDPAQISRHLRGVSSTTLTNYLRITRVFGYCCKIILERAKSADDSQDVLTDLRVGSHKVYRTGSKVIGFECDSVENGPGIRQGVHRATDKYRPFRLPRH
ncbi:hypothetical protein AYJ54_44705 [Bradyrhizobium centrolobii]|uniref:Uncharacterized protein n=1 Tax=Bradyrhizobium centrolobii TaxID=1505087 RepID=A0A176Z204_9BRAD|nr:hypothetical protein AYJ54_44705 [Bradyrhizobium centrolobii]